MLKDLSAYKTIWSRVAMAFLMITLASCATREIYVLNMDDRPNYDRDKLQAAWSYFNGTDEVKKDRSQALRLFNEVAASDLPEAMFGIALIYQEGYTVESDGSTESLDKNIELAIKWHESAALRSHVPAMNSLATIYLRGLDTDVNYELAYSWYEKAAAKGDSLGMNQLGWMHLNALGVEKDYESALYWFRKSRALGNDAATHNIASMYQEGNGVKKNVKEAKKLYREAARNKFPDSMFALGQVLISENNTDSGLELIKEAANLGSVAAQIELGVFYRDGNIVEKDSKEAVFWLRKAVENGEAAVKVTLGNLYAFGDLNVRDYSRAITLFEDAAAEKDAVAMNQLGLMYEYGYGVALNLKTATDWYKKSMKLGNYTAKSNLAWFYYHGNVFEKDIEKAKTMFEDAAQNGSYFGMHGLGIVLIKKDELREGFKLIKKAAENNIDGAQFDLGIYYRDGEGVTPNTERAIYWIQKSAENLNPEAIHELGGYYYRSYGDIAVDKQEARELFKQAALIGHTSAATDYGLMLLWGQGGAKNESEAKRWLHFAAERGQNNAKYFLGELYQQGSDTFPQDDFIAFDFYKCAADKGHGKARFATHRMYENGWGTSKNPELSRKYLLLAAESGNLDALQKIGKEDAVTKGPTTLTNSSTLKTTGRKFAIVIGVSDYLYLPKNPIEGNPSFLTDLSFADKDARDFVSFLQNESVAGEGWEVIKLIGDKATEVAIKNAIGLVLNRARSTDYVYLFFSGHGWSSPYNANDIYLLGYDSDPNKGIAGVGYEFISREISRSRADHVIAFVDACRSGGYAPSKGNPSPPNQKLFSKIDNELKRGNNKIFFTAGTGLQESWEDPKLKNGVFSHYLVDGLVNANGPEINKNQNDTIEMYELKNWVTQKVEDHTLRNQHMSIQHPDVISPTGEILLEIPVAFRE